MPVSRTRAAFTRSSGVLLHPTSLPGGRIGDEARRFVDWLAAAGQRWWQVLPLGPPDAHGSPYSSPSAFAGSPALLANPRARVSADEIEEFVQDHPYWIGDWAAHVGGDAVADQVRFAREWGTVRDHARERGVRILGDIPFYVAANSADTRSHPELFQRGEVAGVPPDDWSATGQRWGNPVYDWTAMRNEQFGWWVERFRRTLELVDAVRIDHFRGFVAYWSIPERLRTARHGRWRRSPGREVFEAVWRELGHVPVVAENLGLITPAVEGLRHEFGMPGCVVLQFLFTENLQNRPHPPAEENVVVYTGTHDNDTTNGWWSGLSPRAREQVDTELARSGIEEPRPSWKLIRLAFASNARTAIVPAQDLLGLGSRARMNFPGRAGGSWRWQLQPGMLGGDLAAELRDLTASSRRDA
jgi:4-alpha-glucanotransferase